ncbi:hypothetical protein [Streptomyces sp. NPDC091215]|uniref:hypothetical protein n=1 Tax=Streptomyces sp. NPDC091215 TaxID=3155192 RepID=UPI0034161801
MATASWACTPVPGQPARGHRPPAQHPRHGRTAHGRSPCGLPVLVTEDCIATHDDIRGIAYTDEALKHLRTALADGVDVSGCLRRSLLDNYQ